MLNIVPNRPATSVQVKIITLYGILKSGVARSTRRVELYMGPPVGTNAEALCEGSTGMNTAGGRSQPLWASGGCSVYRRKAFVTSMLICTVFPGGRRSNTWNVVGRECAIEGMYVKFEMSPSRNGKKNKDRSMFCGDDHGGIWHTLDHSINARFQCVQVELQKPGHGFEIQCMDRFFAVISYSDRKPTPRLARARQCSMHGKWGGVGEIFQCCNSRLDRYVAIRFRTNGIRSCRKISVRH